MHWFLASLVISAVLVAAPSARADDAVPTAAQARKLFRAPRGSLSLGKTNNGTLAKAREIPLRGPGYAFFGMIEQRRTNFATDELAAMIRRAARRVAKQFPGSVLGIGNVANEEGGDVGQSVSHQNGRDADLGFFAFDKRKRRVNMRGFISFGRDGWDKRRRYRFDPERTLALVEALMDDPKAEVQWLFIAAWLKEPMMRLAVARGASEQHMERLDKVLLQPGDSNPHSEHLHLRIYCSVEDRLVGCLERGPIREWAELGEEAWETYIAQLVGVLRMSSLKWKKRALERLAAIRAIPALDAMVDILADEARGTRVAALKAIAKIRHEDAVVPLATRLQQTGVGSRAVAIVDALFGLEGEEADYVAGLILERPHWILRPELDAKSRTSIRRAAIKRLAGTASGPMARLVARYVTDPALTKAANRTLLELTNQRKVGSRTTARLAAFWTRFFKNHGADGWLAWQKRGFEAVGHAMPRGPLDWRALTPLIQAVRAKDRRTAYNAGRVLSRITGYDIEPSYRTRRNNERLWRNWRAGIESHFGRAAETRAARRQPTGL